MKEGDSILFIVNIYIEGLMKRKPTSGALTVPLQLLVERVSMMSKSIFKINIQGLECCLKVEPCTIHL